MTNKEAASLLGWLKSKTNREDDLEAIDMAIDALSVDGDLISRHDAIEAVRKEYEDAINIGDNGDAIAYDIERILSELPSAENSNAKTQNSNQETQNSNGDLIYRADAIGAVKKRLYETAMNNMEDGDIYADIAEYRIDIWLSALPSAEPSLKAIKRQIDEHWYLDPPSAEAVQIPIKLEKRYPESKDEDITDAFMRGYLAGRSSAEAVQGEWIDIDNYYRLATCSRCHKVTMFEKWGEYTKPYNYCPNCGAKMKGGDSE